MPVIHDIPDTSASSLWETIAEYGQVLRIPASEPSYTWSTEDITGLLESICDRFDQFVNGSKEDEKEPFAFLGPIILLRGQEPERWHRGQSSVLVDGQNRLITLTLTMCALFEAINNKTKAPIDVPASLGTWVKSESERQLCELHSCLVWRGKFNRADISIPRILRHCDTLRIPFNEGNYTSLLAKFLMMFDRLFALEDREFDLSRISSRSAEEARFISSYRHIQNFIASRLESDEESYAHSIADPKSDSIRRVLTRLNIHGTELFREKELGQFLHTARGGYLMRYIEFAAYLKSHAVFLRIKTQDEISARGIKETFGGELAA